MRRITVALSLAAALAWTGGCTDTLSRGTFVDRSEEDRAGGSMVVLDSDQLEQMDGTILDAMTGRVPNLKVRRTDNCPTLTLRGPNTMPGENEPKVYVNGTRAQNTCILTGLRAMDARRVEVYPRGVADRAGYDMHAHGLILIFLRDR